MANEDQRNMLGDEDRPIKNYETALETIDSALHLSKPPALELIYKEPLQNPSPKGLFDLAMNYALSAGHTALRVGASNLHEECVYNIAFDFEKSSRGIKGPIITKLSSSEYFWGTSAEAIAAGNGGIYKNSFVGVRLEHGTVPEEDLEKLHCIFEILQFKDNSAQLAYSLTPIHSVCCNAARKIGLLSQEYGNCSELIGHALHEIGQLSSVHSFPKRLTLQFLSDHSLKSGKDLHVVYYHRIVHTKLSAGELETCHGFIHSMQRFDSELYFWNMEEFAHVVVQVPADSENAEARKVIPRKYAQGNKRFAALGPTASTPLTPNAACFLSVLFATMFPLWYCLHFALAFIYVVTDFNNSGVDYFLVQVTQLFVAVPVVSIVFISVSVTIPESRVAGCIALSTSSLHVSENCTSDAEYALLCFGVAAAVWGVWSQFIYKGFA